MKKAVYQEAVYQKAVEALSQDGVDLEWIRQGTVEWIRQGTLVAELEVFALLFPAEADRSEKSTIVRGIFDVAFAWVQADVEPPKGNVFRSQDSWESFKIRYFFQNRSELSQKLVPLLSPWLDILDELVGVSSDGPRGTGEFFVIDGRQLTGKSPAGLCIHEHEEKETFSWPVLLPPSTGVLPATASDEGAIGMLPTIEMLP